MTTASVIAALATNATFTGAGTNYVVQTPAGVLYLVFVDIANDVSFKKSTDGGFSWSHNVLIFAGGVTNLSIWYDRWSNISAGLIHCAYTDTTSADTFYRTINTESSDALSTETTIFAGTSRASNSNLSICRSRGGNVYCHTMIDAGAEGGFFKLLNANVPNGAWEAALTTNEALASADMIILVPGWAADNNDMMAFFWDASANEISRQLYDDSGNSWAETSIAGTMTDSVASTSFPHFAAAVDIANSRNLLVAWSAIDTAGADLRCWHVTEGAITEVTNVVTDSTDDQGLCAIGIDTTNNHWYVLYAGKSDGSETWLTALKYYYKISTDIGTTWGAETLTSGSELYSTAWLACTPRFTLPVVFAYWDTQVTVHPIRVRVQFPIQPRASHQMYGG